MNWREVGVAAKKLEQLGEIFWFGSIINEKHFSITFHGFNSMWGYVHYTAKDNVKHEVMFRDTEELLAILHTLYVTKESDKR